MDNFHALAAQTSLKEMFEGRYFDITTVTQVMKLTGCVGNSKDMAALHALHCVDFSAMTPDLRTMVLERTMAIFEQPGFNMEVLTSEIFTGDTKRLN